MAPRNLSFRNNRGWLLEGRLYGPATGAAAGIIFSHGLFASKDGYKITRLAEPIADAGYALLAYDFSYAGNGARPVMELSIEQEVADLAAAAACFRAETGLDRVHLMGSSMGAAVSLLYAGRGGAAGAAVASLITIAAPVDLRRLFVDGAGIADPRALPSEGVTALEGIPINNNFYKEAAAIDVAAVLGAIRAPVLVIHGGRDAVVDPANAVAIERGVAGPCTVRLIDDGDHALTRDSDIALIRDAVIEWMARHA